MQLTEKGNSPGDPSLPRVLGSAAMLALVAALAGPLQPVGRDDLPWQPVEEVRFSREPNGPIETMTGALLTHDQAALTYLQLEPRRVVGSSRPRSTVDHSATEAERAVCQAALRKAAERWIGGLLAGGARPLNHA